MSDPLAGGIKTDVNLGSDFQKASLNAAPTPIPVMSVQIKPEAVQNIINNIDKIQKRTDDSKIIQEGSKYSFMDLRNNQPLAELDTKSNTLHFHLDISKFVQRVDTIFLKDDDVMDFIKENKVESAAPAVYKVANNGPN